MKSFKFQRLLVLVFLVPTVSSLIITSVYAGKKKFKTFSFGTPLLPSIVKVEPNKFHLTFRNYKYLRTPQFKIEGTIPLKAPTVIKEKFRPDPNPEVTEYNFGDMSVIPEVNQNVNYDDSQNNPVFVEPPNVMPNAQVPPIPSMPASDWKPIINRSPAEFGSSSNHFPTHLRFRRSADEFNQRFDPNYRTSNLNGGNFEQNFDRPHTYTNFMSSHLGSNSHSYISPPNYRNYFNPYPMNSNPNSYSHLNSAQSGPTYQYNPNSNVYHSNHDMTASSSSYAPPKYEKLFNPSNHQNNKWIPIITPTIPSIAQSTGSVHSNSLNDKNLHQKKVNIGEHYNPSASYVDEKMVEKPTYDPDESEPDEGSISFSISGPHGGEEVPAGYESKIKQMHEELKNNPTHVPPGLDLSQLMKYYSHHTFTDPLKTNYGYKPAFGPLGLLKSKLLSWKNIF